MLNEVEDRNPKSNRTKDIGFAVQTAVSVVGLFIALIQIPQYLTSLKARVVVAVLVFIVVLILTYGSVLPRVYNSITTKLKERRAVKILAVTFSKLVHQFKDISADNKCNSIRYCLTQVKNDNPEIFSNDYWFSTLLSAFEGANWEILTSKRNFRDHVHWFDSIIAVFNDQVVCKAIKIINENRTIKLYHNFHDDYANARGDYDAFIRDYRQFAKEVKEKFSNLYPRDYFDPPKQLSVQLTSLKKE